MTTLMGLMVINLLVATGYYLNYQNKWAKEGTEWSIYDTISIIYCLLLGFTLAFIFIGIDLYQFITKQQND